MKNILIKSVIAVTLFGAVSCSKQLDTKPTGSIDASQALLDDNGVKVALTGAYTDFGTADFYGGRAFLEADLLAATTELSWTGTYQGMTQINNKAIPVDNGFVTNVWVRGYKAINDVNNVLANVGVVIPKDSARVTGEAKFIRGASYFELVKMFAKDYSDGSPSSNPGVPLVLSPTSTITNDSYVKRNTVSEVYAQVIKDLTQAEGSLPTSNGFYATKQAAEAMLARVYLQQADYANALKYANLSITNAVSKGAALNPNYADAFGATNTKEDIFAVQVTATSGTQGFNEFYSSSQRGDIQISNSHLTQYELGDDRKNLFYVDAGSYYTGKFEQLHGNVHTIRLAEMYLIRAEANFRLGSSVGDTPLNDVNRIRTRAKLTPLAVVDLPAILKERKLELAFEGFSLDDVKRLHTSVGTYAWNSPKLIFPIPQRDIIVNGQLTQNEGY